MRTLTLGTRGSQLALFQANAVADLLRTRADVACDIVVIKTSGDRLADAALSEVGGKRLFVKEIEDALLAGTVDIAVHSSKDMPAVLPDGLVLGAVLPREDARDAIVLPAAGPASAFAKATADGKAGPYESTEAGPCESVDDLVRRLGNAPRIGTSSVRRTAQLLRVFPAARFEAVRGNLDTRLRKLDSGEYDALILAAAGLTRLGFGARISSILPAQLCIPAPGQGIIAVEVRGNDTAIRELTGRINEPLAAAALEAERAVVVRLGGGCQMPIGAYGAVSDAGLTLSTVVVSLDGGRAVRAQASGALGEATQIGDRAAEQLLAEGAGDILAEVDRARAAVEGLQP